MKLSKVDTIIKFSNITMQVIYILSMIYIVLMYKIWGDFNTEFCRITALLLLITVTINVSSMFFKDIVRIIKDE